MTAYSKLVIKLQILMQNCSLYIMLMVYQKLQMSLKGDSIIFTFRQCDGRYSQSPFYEPCCFLSVAINIMYKLQSFTFM